MTSFNPRGADRDPEEWQELAFRNASANTSQWQLIGGLLLAGTATVAVSPATGALAAVWCVCSCLGGLHKKGRSRLAVRDYGMVAPFLNDEEFASYARQVVAEGGKDKLLEELLFAEENGFELGDRAYNFIAVEAPHLIEGSSGVNLLPSGVMTQSIDTQSSIQGEPDLTIDIVSAIALPVQNCVIFGVGGSGKGMLVANAIRRIKANEPNRKIFYIDPKNEEKEYGYLEGVVDVIKRKTCNKRPEAEICKWLDKCLDEYTEWVAMHEETLLIIDEGTILGNAAKKCKNERVGSTILHISSLGGAGKEKVWLMAQSPFVGPMGLDLTTTSQITSVCLVSEDNSNVVKQWSKSSIMESIKSEALTELFKACPIKSKKRAIFWGGTSKWYAMPILENYSSYNRDEDKPSGDALTTEQRSQLRSRIPQSSPTLLDPPPRPVNDKNIKPKTIKFSQDLIGKLEKSRQETLEDFINKEAGGLPQGLTMQETKIGLSDLIRDRTPLLERFGLGWLSIEDPYEALNFWGANKKSDEEIREAWLLHTHLHLNDQGLIQLKQKLQ